MLDQPLGRSSVKSTAMHVFWIALVVLVLPGFQKGLDASEPSTLEELQQALRAGWEKLVQLDQRRMTYYVTRELNTRKPDPGNSTSQARVRVDWTNGNRLAETIRGEKPGRFLLYSRNTYYAFVIVRENNSNAWKLQGMDTKSGKENPIDTLVLADSNRFYFYPISSTGWGMDPLDLLSDTNFKIIGFKKDTTSEKNLVQFNWRRFVPPLKRWIAYEGTMLVNPRIHWVVEECRWFPAGTRNEFKMNRTVADAGEPLGIVCRSLVTESPAETAKFAFEKFDSESIPAEVFRLSHYGLPEPVDIPPPPSPSRKHVWLLGAGILLLGVSLGGHLLVKRSRNKRPSMTPKSTQVRTLGA